MPALIYRLKNGTQVPGVTTVLREWGAKTPALVHSAWKLGMEGINYRDVWGKARDAGSLTHARCDMDIKGLPPPIVEGWDPAAVAESDKTFAAYLAWKRGTRLELLASEIPLVSEAEEYGGCLDDVGTLDGGCALLDLKSKTLYPDQIVQVAAYRALWNENHPDVPIRSVHILGLTDGFHHHQPTDDQLDAGYEVFLRLLDVYRLKDRIKVSKRKEKAA
jgi:hypothetical protein